jgi:hypothetical protein
MGRCRALLVALILVNLSGCLGVASRSTAALLQKFRRHQETIDPEQVYLDVALVHIPLGDSALHADLWNVLDEQVVPLEMKGLLEQNGFRIGRAGNTAPEELRELVTQRRHCPDPRQIQMPPGKEERVIELGPLREGISFDIHQGEFPSRVALDAGHYALAVKPTLTEDGRTKLHIVPQIRHAGRNRLPWKPSADRSGWTIQFEKPSDAYPSLAWDVSLAPGEYLVIGAREDRTKTFGYEALVRRDERVPVKRLLVLRCWRPAVDPRATEEIADAPRANGAVPLAIQASMSSARGMRD